MDTSSTFSKRAWRPMKEAPTFWNERFHSRIAPTNSDAMPIVSACDRSV